MTQLRDNLACWALFLILPTLALAQTAKVIPLSSTDTQKMKELVAARDAADKALADYRDSIRKRYAETEYEREDWGSGIAVGNLTISTSWCEVRADKNGNMKQYCPQECPPKPEKPVKTPPEPPRKMVKDWKAKPGWENGIEFSDDYKFIVPAAEPRGFTTPLSPWVTPTGVAK
jgi:hypothetical protein